MVVSTLLSINQFNFYYRMTIERPLRSTEWHQASSWTLLDRWPQESIWAVGRLWSISKRRMRRISPSTKRPWPPERIDDVRPREGSYISQGWECALRDITLFSDAATTRSLGVTYSNTHEFEISRLLCLELGKRDFKTFWVVSIFSDAANRPQCNSEA